MATALMAGAAIAGAALLSRAALLALRTGGRGVGAAAGSAGGAIPRAFAGGFERPMDRREAALILGLPPGGPPPTKAAVREAHRRLMRVNHPDSGGSTFVATKVNEAKEMLLGGRRGESVF